MRFAPTLRPRGDMCMCERLPDARDQMVGCATRTSLQLHLPDRRRRRRRRRATAKAARVFMRVCRIIIIMK